MEVDSMAITQMDLLDYSKNDLKEKVIKGKCKNCGKDNCKSFYLPKIALKRINVINKMYLDILYTDIKKKFVEIAKCEECGYERFCYRQIPIFSGEGVRKVIKEVNLCEVCIKKILELPQ